jgi:hypothetical protein
VADALKAIGVEVRAVTVSKKLNNMRDSVNSFPTKFVKKKESYTGSIGKKDGKAGA